MLQKIGLALLWLFVFAVGLAYNPTVFARLLPVAMVLVVFWLVYETYNYIYSNKTKNEEENNVEE